MNDTQTSINHRLDSIDALQEEINEMYDSYAPGHPGPDVMNDIADREEAIARNWDQISALEHESRELEREAKTKSNSSPTRGEA